MVGRNPRVSGTYGSEHDGLCCRREGIWVCSYTCPGCGGRLCIHSRGGLSGVRRRWVKLAQGGSCGVSQHVAMSALDESRAITCDDEFNWFTKHKHALLSGGFYYGVSSVHYGYQDGACRDSEDVGGILLPVWRHPE